MTNKINNSVRGVLQKHESFKDEEEYRNTNCMSYSIFKDVFDNPNILIEPREEKKDEWLIFGTLVDKMLMGSPEDLERDIIVNDLVPSEQYKNMCDYIIANDIDIKNISDTQVEEIYLNSGSKVNWGIPVKRQKLQDNCFDYLNLILENKNKTIISSDLFNEATLLAGVFVGHRWSKHLFMSEAEQKAKNVEIIYQYKIKYILQDVLFKSMIDIVYIDHENKKIHLYDVKTGSDHPRAFLKTAVYRYKYMYQAFLYKVGFEDFISYIPEFDEYTIENFEFVYVSRIKPTYPVILVIDEDSHESFFHEGLVDDRYTLPGIAYVLKALKYYLSKIEEGETVLEPFDLVMDDGKYILGPSLHNMARQLFEYTMNQ